MQGDRVPWLETDKAVGLGNKQVIGALPSTELQQPDCNGRTRTAGVIVWDPRSKVCFGRQVEREAVVRGSPRKGKNSVEGDLGR